MSYIAPVKDMLFCMKELADIESIAKLPGFEDAGFETAQAVLEESARFCQEVLAPLNREGDVNPSSFKEGVVTTTAGFKDAFRQFGAGGWQGLQHPGDFGGQGLPKTIGAACIEMINSANLSFALCPLLTDGAIEALLTAGTREQQDRFIPKMISGEWTGTMNLTEPQAGSDLALVRTRAEPLGDGRYRIFGTKIFITYGEHDYTENIVHMVLGRLPDAPEGVKGISLFLVPKFIPDADGKPGVRNDVHCVSIEHKLGIHASPTAVLAYGDKGGAIGYLVGEENRGLEYMFIMMNLARFSVGLEGVGIAERAYQRAVTYARDRVQGRAVGLEKGAKTPAIIEHPDIRRMLMTMRAYTESTRAVAYVTAAALDNARRNPDASARAKAQAFADFMIPIVKGWSTEVGQDVASLGVQVHGGMGFIEETGAAQHLRDARITTIYEGTTGIQANDLIGRKTARDAGAVAKAIAGEIDKVAARLAARSEPALQAIGVQLAAATADVQSAVEWMVPAYGQQPRVAHAGAVAYLKLWGLAAGGWQMGRAALVAAERLANGDGDSQFHRAKIATARYYADALLPQTSALAHTIIYGGESALALAADEF